MADVNSILSKLDNLAALPSTVLRLTSLLMSGKAAATEIEQVARQDEALSITILRWANSAMFGRPGKTFTLRESITRLGNANLLSIVLQQKTSTMFERAGAAYGLARGELWRSAVGGAFCAQSIARSHKFDNPELAFLCGLLRDIGKLALDAHFGTAYAEKVQRHIRPDRSFLDAEREAFGFDHSQVGKALALKWKLPERIAECIGAHHNPPPPGAGHDTLFDIVHAADVVCLWAGLAIGCDGLQYRLAEHVRTGLDLSRPQAEFLIASAWQDVRSAEQMMSDPSPSRKSA
jgi:HD-like signal output (HDOD) protein